MTNQSSCGVKGCTVDGCTLPWAAHDWSYLASKAVDKCPVCGSTNLIWVDYGNAEIYQCANGDWRK